MRIENKISRLAGLIYLIFVITGIFSLAYVPSQITVPGTKLFWGLWLLPFGYLVLRSGFLPKILGILLMLGCFGYTIDVFGELLVSRYSDTSVSDYVLLPASVGEIGTCLWLLLVGARQPKWNAA